MKDIVLIPTWYRPEYLQLCLEHLAAAEGITSKQIWILQDQHQDDMIRHAVEENWTQEVLATWQPYRALDIKFFRASSHCTVGNSRNVLEGYRRAFETDAQFVYLIEDDVFVTPDFFKWHEAVQNDGDYFCSVGCSCKFKWQNTTIETTDPGAYYTARWYGSYGVGWKRENLSAIIPHARNEYYSNMDNYVRHNLAGTPLGDQFTEQDGVIERVMWKSGKSVAFPIASKAFHLGLYGYHRDGQRPNGFLEAKLAGLRKMLADPETFKNPTNNPYNDIVQMPSTPPAPWEKVTKVQEF